MIDDASCYCLIWLNAKFQLVVYLSISVTAYLITFSDLLDSRLISLYELASEI